MRSELRGYSGRWYRSVHRLEFKWLAERVEWHCNMTETFTELEDKRQDIGTLMLAALWIARQ